VFKQLRQFDQKIEKFVGWVLLISVTMMFSLSVLNIILRWLNTNLSWIEPLVRHLVFLATFLGGVIATGRGSHIGIDILGRWCEATKKLRLFLWIQRVCAATSFLTVLWLIKSSLDFMKMELEFGKPVFWGITSGQLVSIIPIGFSFIAIRFLIVLILSADPEKSHANQSQITSGVKS
jgi:TRAP-type C4-dicarboxylate transport system permease small subunit